MRSMGKLGCLGLEPRDPRRNQKVAQVADIKLTLGNAKELLPPFAKKLSVGEKCEWLRSQILGRDVECFTPFGKRMVTYADHTAMGRSLVHIESFVLSNVLPIYGNISTDDSFVGQRTSQLVSEAALYLKNCLGATSDESLYFCGSGSSAALKRLQEVMGISVPASMRARVLCTMSEEERWVVFTGPFEEQASLLLWRQSLAEIVEIPMNKEGLLDTVKLRICLQDPRYKDRPKLGCFPACSNVTGILTDTRAVARILHAHRAFACFDFAICGPYVEIDMNAGEMDGYDAIFLSPDKFMGGPGSPGVLIMTKQLCLISSSPPSTCGGIEEKLAYALQLQDGMYGEDFEREDGGSFPILEKIRAALALWVKEQMGTELIQSRQTFLIETALRRLKLQPNLIVLGNTVAKRIAIISFVAYSSNLDETIDRKDRLMSSYNSGCSSSTQFRRQTSGKTPKDRTTRRGKPLHDRFVVKLLNDLFGIQAQCGFSSSNMGSYGYTLLGIDEEQAQGFRDVYCKGYCGVRPGWARLSFGYYVSTEDFEFLLSAIEFIADFGQRFLPLYDFNWKTGDWSFRESMQHLINIPERQSSCQSTPDKYNQEPQIITNTITVEEHNCNLCRYLEIARVMAACLPTFPAERPIPEEVDPKLVVFRI